MGEGGRGWKRVEEGGRGWKRVGQELGEVKGEVRGGGNGTLKSFFFGGGVWGYSFRADVYMYILELFLSGLSCLLINRKSWVICTISNYTSISHIASYIRIIFGTITCLVTRECLNLNSPD